MGFDSGISRREDETSNEVQDLQESSSSNQSFLKRMLMNS